MVCCRVCKSTPIIFISASFVPSNLWLEHQQCTRLAVRPTSLCHQTGRLPNLSRKSKYENKTSKKRPGCPLISLISNHALTLHQPRSHLPPELERIVWLL